MSPWKHNYLQNPSCRALLFFQKNSQSDIGPKFENLAFSSGKNWNFHSLHMQFLVYLESMLKNHSIELSYRKMTLTTCWGTPMYECFSNLTSNKMNWYVLQMIIFWQQYLPRSSSCYKCTKWLNFVNRCSALEAIAIVDDRKK